MQNEVMDADRACGSWNSVTPFNGRPIFISALCRFPFKNAKKVTN